MSNIVALTRSAALPASPQDRAAHGAIAHWLSSFRSDNTRRAYSEELKHFADVIRSRHGGGARDGVAAAAWLLVSTETEANVAADAWRAQKIAASKSPASINRSMSALNSFMRSARRAGLTQTRIEPRSERSQAYRDTKGPGLDGVRKLITVAAHQNDKRKGARDVALIWLAFGLGLRRAEIAALNINDIGDDGTLAIIGKGRNGEKQRLTLPPEVRAILRQWLKFRKPAGRSEPLFVSLSRASTEGRITGDGIYKICKELGEMSGLTVRPHGLRHTAITEALNVFNGDFRKVRAFSRHASLDTVRRYDDSRADNAGAVAKGLALVLNSN
jgi:integrase/recombinase XerC